MKKHRLLAVLGLSLVILGIVTQPVTAVFYLNRFDSTGYNHVVENSGGLIYTDINVDSNNGKIEALGDSGPFTTHTTLVLELGFVFDAPESGDFRVAIVWSSSYRLKIEYFWWWWGVADMKVEYVLFSSTHQQLEAKTVLSKSATSINTVVSGTDSMGLANVYRFNYNLVQGTSYVVAARVTFTVAALSEITSATSTSNPACIDVDQINIRH